MSFLLKLCEGVSIFDWVTPFIGLFERATHGNPLDAQPFSIPYYDAAAAGWSTDDIENLLAQYGIQTWGGTFNVGNYQVCVPAEAGELAEYILLRHGVPYQ